MKARPKHQVLARQALRAMAWFALGLVLAGVGLSLWSAAYAQTVPAVMVSMQRADDVRGMQQIECWLRPHAAGASYVAGLLVIDCLSDPERIFANGFEVQP